MKRIQLQPWTTYEKFCLACAVQRAGDQNWTAVSRAAKNIFEDSTKTRTVDRRPPEWFSMKQCAAQYEFLLKNVVGPRRKKRTEKGPDVADTPAEIIMNVLRQDYLEELKQIIAEEQMMYLKIKKENEDIDAGLLDDKLEEMLAKIEAKEREKDIRIKLKYKLEEKRLENDAASNKSLDVENAVSQPENEVKPSSATSPLLTSLLQSPSPLTRPSVPSSISLLLNSSPTIPSNESPTLSKLLESPTPIRPPTPHTLEPTPVVIVDQTKNTETPRTRDEKREVENQVAVEEDDKSVKAVSPEHVIDDIVHGVVESEVVIGHDSPEEKKKPVVRRLDLELEDMSTAEEVMETVEQIIEKVEEAIIETVGETVDGDLADVGLNQTIESENIEDHIDSLDLDHEAVELIVMGPNQGPVIAVHHRETSSENSSKLSKDGRDADNTTSTLNDVSSMVDTEVTRPEEIVDDKQINTKDEGVRETKLEELEKEVVEHHEVHSEVVVEEVIEESKSDSETFQDWAKVSEDNLKEMDKTSEHVAEVIGSGEFSSSVSISDTCNIFGGEGNKKGPNEKAKLEEESPPANSDDLQSESADYEVKEPAKILEDPPSTSPGDASPKKFGSPARGKEDKIQQDLPSTPQSGRSSVSKDETQITEREPESEKRKTIRKRSNLGIQLDSKPNSPASSLIDDDKDYRAWKKSILLVYNRLAAHKYASVFLKPITEAEAVGYHRIIKRPMDLTTIKRNIESGLIRTTVEFQRDMLLMVQNAIMYNKSNTLVFKMAHDMLNDMLAQMEIMVQAIGDGVPLQRDAYDGPPTRGRSSKQHVEESSKRKRSSIGEDSRSGNKRRKMDV